LGRSRGCGNRKEKNDALSRNAYPHDLAAQRLGIPPGWFTWTAPTRMCLRVKARCLDHLLSQVGVALAQFYLWNPLLRETLDVVNQQALDAAPFENARSNEKVGET
jgi:hypothetical protein